MTRKKPFDAKAIRDAVIHGVGYKQPPAHTRFQKGVSGNPLGRPKRHGSKRIDTAPSPAAGTHTEAIRRVLEEPVKVRDGTGTRLLPKGEAVQRNLEKLAFKDAHAPFHTPHKWLFKEG